MDRDIQLGNRLIANYMQEKQKKRLKQRLKHIKLNKSQYSSQGHIKDKPQRANSLFFQKNLQIEKQNIAMFNRIASIIKKQPKPTLNQQSPSTSLIKSRQTNSVWHRKIQSSLQQQNKLIEKRLFNQKPTINNKSFYQERSRHLQYLKNISKYPYILGKNLKTQPYYNILEQINNINATELPPIINGGQANNQFIAKQNIDKNNDSVKELFKHTSLDFTISIKMDLKQNTCTFEIKNHQNQQEFYTLTVPKIQFVTYFEQSEYDYEKMVSNLRLNQDGKIIYQHQQSNKKYTTPKQEKQTFKYRAQSTAYTSTGFKQGFRTSKRIATQKSEKKEKQTCKTDRNPNLIKTQQKNARQLKKQSDSFSQNKFIEPKFQQ